MRRFCAALGLSTILAAGLGGCAGIGAAPGEEASAADAYASGKQHFAAGRLGLALTDFQRALQEQGPSIERLNALGATYDRLSRFDLADRAYRQALALDPNAPQTLNNLGYSYMLRGRADLASAYLARAQSVAKSDPVIGSNLTRAKETLSGPAPQAPAAPSLAAPAQPAPAPIPVEFTAAPAPVALASTRVAVSEPAAPAVVLLRPQHGTQIVPIAKGVFQLVTIGEEEPEAPQAAAAQPHSTQLASAFEVPQVIEAMPAVAAAPVAKVEAEPLHQIQAAAPAASPAEITVAKQPMAGIIKASADASEAPFAPQASEAARMIAEAPAGEPDPEPLRQVREAAPAASPAELTVAMQPMAGIIRASVDASEVPFAPQASETAGAVAAGWGLLAGAMVEVSNGSGIERSGARFRAYLRGQGVPVKRLTNDAQFGHDRTVLYYRDGYFAAAQAIASELSMPIAIERNDQQRSDLRLRLGLDSQPFDKYLAAGIITASR
jgi:hypothetical protein